ncbi:UDP-Glycosyltransferase superfamily protein [Perilla frutescens var. hirtella]|nr:UDP-Glycosyltransferase superfamily protein [Perilla frutescens var. hirtella]KAH6807377.1 UDP-Glycosyltransferase superfamily protein [Perilla frutescens var. frutescens]
MKEMIEKPHAIMFPYPLQGHVIPFVNLAIKLASNGFTITFINTESIHHQICQSRGINPEKGDIFLGARASGLDTRYATVSDGFPLGFDRSLHHDEFFEGIMHDFPTRVDDLVGEMVRQDPTINTLIVDTFYVWPSSIARKHNLVNVSFFTEPALVLTSYYHVHLLKKNAHFASSTRNRSDEIDYIPGVKSIATADLPSYLQAEECDTNTTVHRIIDRCFNDAKKADFMLCNTVEEFEQDTISALQENQPFYSIGPVFPPDFTKNRIATSLWTESDCTPWLDTKARGSVLYVSFGSYAHTSKHVIEEVANGLLLSGVNFIWVVRPDIVGSDHPEVLPVGFEQQVEGRGLVVPWCCQMEVISHGSVGGFLTHCGWNSILESIWCGVPLICYPLLTDQFTNRKLVVDDLKIGINLCDKKLTPSRKGVAQRVNYLMRSEEIKQRMKEIGKILVDATEKEGSSTLNFNRFVEDLMARVAMNKGDVNDN